MIFEVPWPQSSNHLYATLRTGRRVLSKKGREYHKTVGNIVMVNVRPYWVTPLLGRLEVYLDYHAPYRRRYDIMNFNKCLLDALTKCQLYEDDSQIDKIHQERSVMLKPGKIIVEIFEIL